MVSVQSYSSFQQKGRMCVVLVFLDLASNFVSIAQSFWLAWPCRQMTKRARKS